MNNTGAKINSLAEVSDAISKLRGHGKKVVQCHGVFDLMHPGHIRHLKAARCQGDVLVVTVTPDQYVDKGPGRPVFNERLRAESLAALRCVDLVAINQWPTAVETIRLLRPDVYVKGNEYSRQENDVTGKIYEEERAVLEVGGRIYFTDDITFSSSQLINANLSLFPSETEEWLKSFRQRHSPDDVLGYLKKASDLKVLVVGEAIIDEYVFCDGLGKSTKDPILAFLYRWTEAYGGGSIAVANHLAGFCDNVGLVTLLGETERREDFVRGVLRPNVNAHLLTQQNAPTIQKRRFVDTHTSSRMFELYMMSDKPLDPGDEAATLEVLSEIVRDYDVVLVTDYGHGMLTPKMIESINNKARFLAVNTQVNAGNRGLNTISRYSRADYVCLAALEVALEMRMTNASKRDLVLELSKRIECPRFTVTQGKEGSLHYDRQSGITEIPALATHITDRVGAGDAFLAVTSLLVAQGTPWDIVGFVGNLAGARMVEELGNRVTVSMPEMAKHVVSLMK